METVTPGKYHVRKAENFTGLLGFLYLASNTIGMVGGLLELIILSKLALKDSDFRNMKYLTE